MSKKHGTPLSLGEEEALLGTFLRASVDLSRRMDSVTSELWSGNTELIKAVFQQVFLPPSPDLARGIVGGAVVIIGGGRTTDQFVADFIRRGGDLVHPFINQANMPSGHGRRRPVFIEFFGFAPDYSPTTSEVRARCEEPGYDYPSYEAAFRFLESHPDNPENPIFIPRNPWCNTLGDPQALRLWKTPTARGIDLGNSLPEIRWSRETVFARVKLITLNF